MTSRRRPSPPADASSVSPATPVPSVLVEPVSSRTVLRGAPRGCPAGHPASASPVRWSSPAPARRRRARRLAGRRRARPAAPAAVVRRSGTPARRRAARRAPRDSRTGERRTDREPGVLIARAERKGIHAGRPAARGQAPPAQAGARPAPSRPAAILTAPRVHARRSARSSAVHGVPTAVPALGRYDVGRHAEAAGQLADQHVDPPRLVDHDRQPGGVARARTTWPLPASSPSRSCQRRVACGRAEQRDWLIRPEAMRQPPSTPRRRRDGAVRYRPLGQAFAGSAVGAGLAMSTWRRLLTMTAAMMPPSASRPDDDPNRGVLRAGR